MFFKKVVNSETKEEKIQTFTVMTAEWKLKGNDEVFRRKNIAGVRRKGKLLAIYIFTRGKEHFDQIIVPLNSVEYINFFFTEKPVYSHSYEAEESNDD